MKNSIKKLSLNKMTITNLCSNELSLRLGGKTGPNCIVITKSCNQPLGCESILVKCGGVGTVVK